MAPLESGGNTNPITKENPISDSSHGDTQPFNSPSQLHDKLGEEEWDASEWRWLRNTVSFDDTFPIEDNFETQQVDFGAETQVLDDLDYFEGAATQLVDDFDQIVRDSDGEGSDRTEVLVDDDNADGELGSDKMESMDRKKSLCTTVCENNADEFFELRNKVTVKQQISGSGPRFTSVRAASLRAAGLAARDSVLKVMKNNGSSTKCPEGVKKGCDARGYNDAVKVSSNGNKNDSAWPPTVKDLITDNLSAETEVFNEKNYSTGGRNGGFSGLSYVDSQEPGESSQADALACVQRLINETKDLFDNDLDQGRRSRVKSTCTLNVKGPPSLAKKFGDKSINRRPGIFDWDDELEDEGGGDILCRRKGDFFGLGNLVGRSFTNPQKAEGKSKLQNEKAAHSDSKLILHNMEAIEKAVKERGIRRNLANEFNEHSRVEALSRQSDATLAQNNVHNVGLDTQIAAEAMEALFHGEGNANHNANDAHQGLPDNSIDPPKGSRRRKTPVSKECFSSNNFDFGVSTRQSRRRKSMVAMSGNTILVTSHKNCANHEKEFCSNPVTRSKRAEFNSKKFVVITGRKIMKNVSKSENLRKVEETTEKSQLNDPDGSHAIASSRDQTVKEQHLVEKFDTCTPIAHRTRRNSSAQLKNIESVVSGSEAADRPLVFGISVEAFKALTEKGKISELHSFPRKKRSLRDFSDQHKKPDNLSVQCKSEDAISKSGTKRSRGNAGITISDSNMKRITRSSTSRDGSHQNRNLEGKVSPLGVDEPVSADITDRQKLSTNLKGTKASEHLDQNPDRASRLAKGKIHSSPPGKAGKSSEPACTPLAVCVSANAASPACVTPMHAASPVCAGDGYVTPSCKKNLSRSSLMRETNSLCRTPEPPPIDSRKRRDLAGVRILFSHHLDNDIIKQQKKIADRLKVQVVSSITDATHFITDNFVRTRNMLEAIASGKPIVTHLWLEDVGQANYYIDEHKYILRDTKKEKELGFNMICSLVHALQHPLLQGHKVLITPNAKPGKEIISCLVKAVHGQAVERVGRTTLKDNMASDDLLILSCEEDYQLCVPFLEKGANVYSSELLLNGIVIQKLEYERHRLFADYVKRTRSTMWLKKDGHNFIPVTRK